MSSTLKQKVQAPGQSQKRKRRHHVKRACKNCRSSHLACDDSRPCKQCTKRGIHCEDRVVQEESRKRERSKTAKTTDNDNLERPVKRRALTPDFEEDSYEDSYDSIKDEAVNNAPSPLFVPSNAGPQLDLRSSSSQTDASPTTPATSQSDSPREAKDTKLQEGAPIEWEVAATPTESESESDYHLQDLDQSMDELYKSPPIIESMPTTVLATQTAPQIPQWTPVRQAQQAPLTRNGIDQTYARGSTNATFLPGNQFPVVAPPPIPLQQHTNQTQHAFSTHNDQAMVFTPPKHTVTLTVEEFQQMKNKIAKLAGEVESLRCALSQERSLRNQDQSRVRLHVDPIEDEREPVMMNYPNSIYSSSAMGGWEETVWEDEAEMPFL